MVEVTIAFWLACGIAAMRWAVWLRARDAPDLAWEWGDTFFVVVISAFGPLFLAILAACEGFRAMCRVMDGKWNPLASIYARDVRKRAQAIREQSNGA